MLPRRTNHHLQRAPHASRPAFTLVEVLIVIVIIGILAALLLPAINGALRTGRNAEEYHQLSQMSLALESFKNRYNCYPPSRIRLREGTPYVTDSSDPNYAFDQHSVKWLKKIWPDIDLRPDPSDSSQLLNWIIWCKDSPNETEANRAARSSYTPQTYDLEGDECLVFFLGGIAEFDRGSGDTIILHGFTDNPRNPGGVPDASNPITQSRIGPLYEFQAGRLFIREGSSKAPSDFGFTTGDTRTVKLPSYRSSLAPGVDVPYAYFSSYEGQGYRPRDCEFQDEPTGKRFQEQWPSVTTQSSGHIFAQGPNPYYITIAAPDDDTTIIKPFAPQKFQLIAPGPDGKFGAGGSLNVVNEAESGGQNTVNTGDGLDYGRLLDDDRDNIANVTDGSTVGDYYRENAK